MLIDFHTHIFPDALAEKVVPMLAAKGGVTPRGEATLADTRAKMKESGVDRAVMLSIATNAKQMKKVNDFAAAVNCREIIAFGSVYPDCPEAAGELDRIARLGLKGVKFHPEYQGFSAGSEEYLPLYEKCVRLGLIVVFHAGRDVAYPDTLMASPKALAGIARRFPEGKFVFAHMGGYGMAEEVLEQLCGSPAYFDTAVMTDYLSPEHARRIVAAHGAERVLFGTDLPWGSAKEHVAYLEGLGLTREELRQIYYKNAEKLLGE